MNINIYHLKLFTGFLSILPFKSSVTTLCFLQEKNPKSAAQGADHTAEMHPFLRQGGAMLTWGLFTTAHLPCRSQHWP